jgi:hypothetical protein
VIAGDWPVVGGKLVVWERDAGVGFVHDSEYDTDVGPYLSCDSATDFAVKLAGRRGYSTRRDRGEAHNMR